MRLGTGATTYKGKRTPKKPTPTQVVSFIPVQTETVPILVPIDVIKKYPLTEMPGPEIHKPEISLEVNSKEDENK